MQTTIESNLNPKHTIDVLRVRQRNFNSHCSFTTEVHSKCRNRVKNSALKPFSVFLAPAQHRKFNNSLKCSL